MKGFLNRIDYAASGGYDIESPGRINFADRIKKYHKDKNDDFEWNELQKWTVEHNDDSIVFVAQTGMGKTEAALRWAGNNKTFLFCLLDQRLMLFLIGLEHKHLAVKMNLMNTYLFYIRICPTR